MSAREQRWREIYARLGTELAAEVRTRIAGLEARLDAAEHCGHTHCLKRLTWFEEWGRDWPACPACRAAAGEPCRDRRTSDRYTYTRRPHPGRRTEHT